MKKIAAILGSIMLLICPLNLSAQENDQVLDLNAKSVVLIERNTGEILYQDNSNESLPPASMTKMMTLLLIAEAIDQDKLDLAEMVRISEYAASMGGSQVFLEENEEMSVDDLLKAIAVGSANDASVALAEHLYGSESAFVKAMNEKVGQLDLKHTHFNNTTGLPAKEHYSSAHDMAMIARELLKYDFITDYTSIYEDYLRKGTEDEFWLVNTNRLIKFYPGVDGLKTGFTQEAKYCLTATAEKNDMRLIAVVMGAETPKERNANITRLLDYGFSQFEHHKVYGRHEAVQELDVLKGKKSRIALVTDDAVSIVTKKGGNLDQLEVKVKINENVMAPLKAGEMLGSLMLYWDEELVDEIALISKEAVDRASFWQLMKDSAKHILELGQS
ncbi:D-alanyl-D-alanine carboxypeptidase family protein [Amphibacillus cookii]|uniref:D-alanyl-D-alanine carboxypeptidase family protein n=1 Tax=Amphibacillus cookii TaxID=767787 RepID=UPI00195C3EE9|nr:D-alanyl-D-alanine carboxypeptidase family protein [Amphibacillus cookii]MBM7542472.1 D-alanyl-D-alanine carboxypeptidase (penicillin-binding protein 5/6) [Amphibacillus cookii]